MITLALAALGGWISRVCGGGRPYLPFGLAQWLYAIPYGLAVPNPAAGLLCYGLAVIGKRMGHGQYIHLGGYRQPTSQDETIDPILRFFFGIDYGGAYWRCVAGLCLTGLCVTFPCGIAMLLCGNWQGLIVAFSGASKGLAYMIGNIQHKWKPTVVGEVLTGVFGWGVIAYVS